MSALMLYNTHKTALVIASTITFRGSSVLQIGSNFKMYLITALCLHITSFVQLSWPTPPPHNVLFETSRYNEQFISVQMSIVSIGDTGPILLRNSVKYCVCYHWKDMFIRDPPPPEVNLNATDVICTPVSLRPKLCIA